MRIHRDTTPSAVFSVIRAQCAGKCHVQTTHGSWQLVTGSWELELGGCKSAPLAHCMFEVEGCSWESLEHYNLSLEQQLLALGYCNLKMALRLVHYNLILIGLGIYGSPKVSVLTSELHIWGETSTLMSTEGIFIILV